MGAFSTEVGPKLAVAVLPAAGDHRSGVVIRVLGLDAPERRGRWRAEARLAAQSTARLQQLVQHRVWLERKTVCPPWRLVARPTVRG
jgi:endonuclease YncB( thermonuclease family)